MAATKSKIDNQAIVGPVRLAYLNVYEPRRNEMAERDEYGAVLLIPKASGEFCADPKGIAKGVSDLIKALATEKWGKVPSGFVNPLKDGDESDDDAEPKHPGYWWLRTSAREEYAPTLIDRHKNKVAKDDGWVSGDWGKVKIAMFAWEHAGRKGVSAGLRGIQFLRKDEPFGGGGNALDGFEEEDGDDAATTKGGDEYDPFADD